MNAKYDVLEIRAKILPDISELYVLCGPASDGTLGVQGWHYKALGLNSPVVLELVKAMKSSDYLLWPLKSPDD